MTRREEELRERLDRDGPKTTAEWYIQVIADNRLDLDDLSPFEQSFWSMITQDYMKWLKQRALH